MSEATTKASKARETNGAGSELKEDLEALRADMAKLIEDVAKIAKARVGEDVSESAAKIKDAVGENVDEIADKARGYVRENPIAACVTAAAAGFALALLLKR